MQLETIFDITGYAITGGSRYCWASYGHNAWTIDLDNIVVCFDLQTLRVYDIAVHSDNSVCFKWIDPDFLLLYEQESKDLGFDPWIAYDDVKYQQIYHDQDILQIIDKML